MKFFYALLFMFITVSGWSQSNREPERNSSSKLVKFYPNPATSVINFDLQKTEGKSYNFQIFNFLGKKVHEINNVTAKTSVNLNDFYRGVYIFQISDRNGKVIESGKFQVSK